MLGDGDEFEEPTPADSPDISVPSGRAKPRRATPRPPNRWMTVGGLVLVVGVLVGLFFWPRSSTDTAGGQAAPEPAVRPTSAPITPTTPAQAPTPVDDLQSSAAAQLQAPTPTPERSVSDSPVDAGPLLGESSGLWLFYGGRDHLQRLDLDTGVVDTFGVRAVPIASSGSELILMTHDTGAVGWVALDDPNEQGDGWIDARVATDERPGFLWRYNLDDQTWTRLDLGSGLIIERRAAPRQVFADLRTDFRLSTVAGPDVITTPSGMYEWLDGAYQRVGAGTVFVYTATDALIESCGDSLDSCVTSWVDRATFDPSDPIPSQVPPGRLYGTQFVGGGSWLHLLYENGESYLQSTTTDRIVAIADDATTIAVSPDGAWLAVGATRGAVDLVQLSSGETIVTIDAFDTGDGGGLLFVEQ